MSDKKSLFIYLFIYLWSISRKGTLLERQDEITKIGTKEAQADTLR